MATMPRDAMQQAAMQRAPQPAPGGQPGGDVAGQIVGLLDQAKSIALQPQNFSIGGAVVTDWARKWILTMLQLAKSKGAAGPATAAQPMAPTPTQPGAMPTGAPAAPTGAGQPV